MKERLEKQTKIFEQVSKDVRETKRQIRELEKELERKQKWVKQLEFAKKIEENCLKKIIKEMNK